MCFAPDLNTSTKRGPHTPFSPALPWASLLSPAFRTSPLAPGGCVHQDPQAHPSLRVREWKEQELFLARIVPH
eukprot:3097592-Amphidinium_carterae.1